MTGVTFNHVRQIVWISYLYALLVERVLVKVKYGCLDRSRRRQHRQSDVDGVTPLGIQDDDLLPLAVRCCFLEHKNKVRINAGSPSVALSLSVCGRLYGLEGSSLSSH